MQVSADPASEVRWYVFVPGISLGGWSWLPTANALARRGHEVTLLTLPGFLPTRPAGEHHLRDAVHHVVEAVAASGHQRRATLVCHSWGGYPATGAAQELGDRVRQLIYYNAVVPARGVSMAGENESIAQAIRAGVAASADGTIPTTLDVVRSLFMPDEPEQLQQLVYSMVVPTPGSYVLEALERPQTVVDLGTPAAYILGSADISLARPGAEFAARIGLEPHVIAGSHMTMFTQPKMVADAIELVSR